VFDATGKRGHSMPMTLRAVVDATLYTAQTGCRWRYVPQSFPAHGAALRALHAAAHES
jgi:transposase